MVEPVQADPEQAEANQEAAREEAVLLQTIAAAAGLEPMTAVSRMVPETYHPASVKTSFEQTADAVVDREAAVLAELADATVTYGSPLAAAQALFGSHSGKPLRSG